MIFDYDDIIVEINHHQSVVDLICLSLCNKKLFKMIQSRRDCQQFYNHRQTITGGEYFSLFINPSASANASLFNPSASANALLSNQLMMCGTHVLDHILFKPTFLDIKNVISVHGNGYHAMVWCRDGFYANYSIYDTLDKLAYNIDDVNAIAIGYEYHFMLKKDGLYGKGTNTHGQLGLNTLGFIVDPTRVAFFDDIVINKIRCGRHHTIVITDNHVYGFGKNTSDQLGHHDHVIVMPTILTLALLQNAPLSCNND